MLSLSIFSRSPKQRQRFFFQSKQEGGTPVVTQDAADKVQYNSENGSQGKFYPVFVLLLLPLSVCLFVSSPLSLSLSLSLSLCLSLSLSFLTLSVYSHTHFHPVSLSLLPLSQLSHTHTFTPFLSLSLSLSLFHPSYGRQRAFLPLQLINKIWETVSFLSPK